LKLLYRVGFIPLKAGRNIWSHCDLNDVFLVRERSGDFKNDVCGNHVNSEVIWGGNEGSW